MVFRSPSISADCSDAPRASMPPARLSMRASLTGYLPRVMPPTTSWLAFRMEVTGVMFVRPVLSAQMKQTMKAKIIERIDTPTFWPH